MKKSFLKIFTTLTFFSASASLAFSATETNINFVVPVGIPEIAIQEMRAQSNPDNAVITYLVEKNSGNLINSVLKGEPDFAIVPSNLVERISEKNIPYSVLGTAGWGSFYLIGYNTLKKPQELDGKKILINGKGLTPDLISNAVLKKVGAENYIMEYQSTPNDVAFLFLGKKVDYAIVPEPVLSELLTKNPDIKILLDFNELWRQEFHSKYGYPQSTLIVKNDFYKNNPQLSKEITERFRSSINYLNSNPDSQIYSDFNLNREKVKRMNLNFIPGTETVGTYKIYLETIGGKNFNDKIFK